MIPVFGFLVGINSTGTFRTLNLIPVSESTMERFIWEVDGMEASENIISSVGSTEMALKAMVSSFLVTSMP